MGQRTDGSPGRSRRWLLACVIALALGLATSLSHRANAEDAASTCAPAIGRLVSLQGSVEIQRAGSKSWIPVQRLDTSLCAGDRLRTGALSRAALFLQPETLVRIDQNTTITLNLSNEEIEVEFFGAELAAEAMNAKSFGAAYFITRFPKKFKVKTPHVNAAVEGTEFMVELTRDATHLTVIEGKVTSESVATHDTQMVASGQSFASGATGPGAITTVIKPQDAVQWVLRYPPLSDGPSGSTRAEKLLRAGSVDEALAAIDEVLVADPGNSDGIALRAVIQLAKNENQSALESAGKATAGGAGNHRAWLALSYAQQAAFDLDAALKSALQAESLQTSSSLAHARVAELYLSLGDTKHAEVAARAAIEANSAESHAHSMLGFVHLAQIETSAARLDFEAAIERDSFSAMPRLGLGLAEIRQGELVAGREQIEIAVALDPSNSLLRSYVGKAYYEENSPQRDTLAATQFALARELDPKDPTPWFYEAILQHSKSEPSAALRAFHRSSELNGARAVYRSRELIDQDQAARGASQATVYNELGFHQSGLVEANWSLAADPGSSSAHRFLADMYATLPRFGIARASELLQSQLRQPLGAPPLQPQLANDVIFQNSFFGPTTVGLDEFNPLFVHDGISTQVFGLLGNFETWGDQVILNGLNGPFSFSLSQLATETEGYRPNDDDSVRQYDVFMQWQFSDSTSAQVEATEFTRVSGDLISAFDPGFISDVLRNDEEVSTQRLGLRHAIDGSSDFLVSVIRQDRHAKLDFPDPQFPAAFVSDHESWKAELQYLAGGESMDVILGASYFTGQALDVFVSPPDSFPSKFDPRHFNVYGYMLYSMAENLPQIQLGLSYDDLSSDVGEQAEVNPKLGIMWRVSDSLTLRAGAFRSLKRRVNSDQGLEPTQVAGFNQLFDDRNGSVSEGVGLGADYAAESTIAAGVQGSYRNVKVPTFDGTGGIRFQHQRENVVSAYIHWLATEAISVAFDPRYQNLDGGSTFNEMELTELPLSIKYVAPVGVWLGVSVTGVDQSGVFSGPGGFPAEGADRFWVVDAIAAYRLPRRNGTLSVEGRNLFDKKFQFQEIDIEVQPRYIPEAQWQLRFSLNF